MKVHIGPALEKMKELQAAGCDPFDLIFIDADKRKYREYYGESCSVVDGQLGRHAIKGYCQYHGICILLL